MRAIIAPNEDPQVVYQTCVNSITDENLRYRLNEITNAIGTAALEYHNRATSKQLYTLPSNNCSNEEIALGTVSKKELTSVYSSHMVGKTKPARYIYDSLLSRAPLGRCPFCGTGYASTLDHYLPKTKYPQLSVVPINLVPSCKDCNTGKSSSISSTAGQQNLHPYYDHQYFIDEQWLYAEVLYTKPATIRFYVLAPNHWDNTSKMRVQSHFEDFKLAARYSIEASNQIACLRDTLSHYRESLGTEGVRKHLIVEAETSSKQHKNSWQTAMFQALANNDWYCNGGFYE
ncbi:HNH endonuclease [Microbulbifer sp. JMSA003]|uniref:HNH endonuclease n=1 Tax=Microbulbifer sp. JMSA003 TaxID=3243369 RepID=UPI004039BA9A